jgi:LuxR family transcriptional regulator, maltose regulon positive regulatory protein
MPPTRTQQNWLTRPRLLALLDGILGARLTVIEAPAGSGKTTAVRQWLAARNMAGAWLSLDEGANEPLRFLRSLAGALAPELANLLSLDALIDVLPTMPPSVLVLDDYHAIEHPDIHQMVGRLIQNLPPHLHMVIISRTAIPIPLGRLRANHDLSEISGEALAFSMEESSSFFQESQGIHLSSDALQTLHDANQGWAVGLQLAVLMLGQGDDVDKALRSFGGGHAYVVGYFAEEILGGQPADLQSFLLQTAILDRLHPDLCDALLSREDSAEILEILCAKNLFILPDSEGWYRYHALFGEFLRLTLQRKYKEALPELHRRAGRWFESQGLYIPAIDHTLAAGDFESAAHIIEGQGEFFWQQGSFQRLVRWLALLPTEILCAYPRLGLLHLWVLFFQGKFDLIKPYMLLIEPHIQQDADRLEMTCFSAYLAALEGDIHYITEVSANSTWDSIPGGERLFHTYILPALGLSHLYRGEIREASRLYQETLAIHEAGGNVIGLLMTLAGWSLALYLQGRLEEAFGLGKQILEEYASFADPASPISGMAYLLLCAISYEWNDLEAARHYGTQSAALWKSIGNGQFALLSTIQLAIVEGASENEAALGSLLHDIEKLRRHNLHSDFAGLFLPRLYIQIGQTHTAYYLAQEAEPFQGAAIPAMFQQVNWIRVLLAQKKSSQAAPLLEDLLRKVPVSQQGLLIELGILRALAHEGLEDPARAAEFLTITCEIAGGTHHTRLFLDESAALLPILRRISQHPYARKLLDLLGENPSDPELDMESMLKSGALLEPLNERELEILRFIAEGYSSKRIAEELFVAVSTIHWHIHHLYQKLDVHARTQAVAKARQLGLLGDSG